MISFDAINFIAEQKIREAQEAGAFDDLPGAGAPLKLEDDGNVPQELRLAYKILKNSGALPPELQDRKDALNLVHLLENNPDEQKKLMAIRKLRFLLTRMKASRTAVFLEESDFYQEKILAALEKHEKKS